MMKLTEEKRMQVSVLSIVKLYSAYSAGYACTLISILCVLCILCCAVFSVWLATQNHSTLVTDTTVVPFLPVNPEYSSTRNQASDFTSVTPCLNFHLLLECWL